MTVGDVETAAIAGCRPWVSGADSNTISGPLRGSDRETGNVRRNSTWPIHRPDTLVFDACAAKKLAASVKIGAIK